MDIVATSAAALIGGPIKTSLAGHAEGTRKTLEMVIRLMTIKDFTRIMYVRLLVLSAFKQDVTFGRAE